MEFLERGFICIQVCVCMCGGRFADFIYFFLKYPMKMKILVSLRPKLFHFHRIFKKTRGGEGVQANALNHFWIRHCILAHFTRANELLDNRAMWFHAIIFKLPH